MAQQLLGFLVVRPATARPGGPRACQSVLFLTSEQRKHAGRRFARSCDGRGDEPPAAGHVPEPDEHAEQLVVPGGGAAS